MLPFLNGVDPNRVPTFKLIVHLAQIILIFVIWCLAINIFVDKKAAITGQNGWTFGACFLTIPAWIYLLMTPRWERTRHLAHPVAMLAVDAVFTVVWLSAFASQAAYNTANDCGNACGQSKAIVGLGVVTTLSWVASVFLSLITYQAWRTDGSMPGYDSHRLAGSNIDPDKAAFSMAPHDEEAYAPVNMDERDGLGGDEYASGAYGGAPYGGARYDDDDLPDRFGAHSARPNPLFESETSYGGGSGSAIHPPRTASPAGDPYAPPSGRFDEPAQFPAGNYDRVH